MSDSLRDQLLGLGFKPAPKPERKPEHKHGPRPGQRRDDARKQGGGKPHAAAKGGNAGHKPRPARSQEEIDLAKAYAIRAQKEKEERIEAERQKQEQARLRREAKARLEALLQQPGRALNDANAEIARHFPYGGKIKRIHVTPEQLKALNAAELGVVQLNGRYLLVDAHTLTEAEAIFPQSVALKVDPNAPAEEDPYADPKYQVPDDLVW